MPRTADSPRPSLRTQPHLSPMNRASGMPDHQRPPTIDIGVAAGSIPDIGGGGRAIGQHGPITTTTASIGHAIITSPIVSVAP